jgi:hypothetical protein
VIVHQLAILELSCLSRGVGKFSLLQLLAAVCESRYSYRALPGTSRPDRDGLSCRRGGAVVSGYRSDGNDRRAFAPQRGGIP